MSNQDLKKVGLKITLPRIKILNILAEAKQRHMSAEEVYRALLETGEEVSIATIYRVLTQFQEAGLVTRHNFEGDHAVFELSQGEHHDHLVCVRCGRVEEFVDEIIESHQKLIAKNAGYEMTDHSLNIYGVCPRCQKGGIKP